MKIKIQQPKLFESVLWEKFLILCFPIFLSQAIASGELLELEGLGTVFLGAPEMLLDSEAPEAREALERGSRVLVLALSQEKLDHHNHRNHLIFRL